MKLEGKFAVVTGGARGIGEGLARRFMKEGARQVAVLDLDAEGARRVADEIGGVGFGLDVRDELATRELLARLEAEHGPIDLMCANAGIATMGGLELDDDGWQKIWEINTMSHVWAARAVIPSMVARGEGYFLSVASAAGLLTTLGAVSYAVTKHAAVAFAEWLSITHGDQGVRVSCLCPMGVATPMIESSELSQKMLKPDAISVDDLADAVIQGLDDERFLILPHPQVAQFESYKAARRDDWLASMRTMQRELGYASHGAPEPTLLSGPVTPSQLLVYPAWREGFDAALAEDSGALDDVPPGAQIEVILGAWCPDCVRELTRMWRAFDGRTFDVRYVAVDVSRDAGGAPHAEFDALPTIVVRREGEEVGRIVEASPNGVERDLGAMLRGEVSGVVSATRLE